MTLGRHRYPARQRSDEMRSMKRRRFPGFLCGMAALLASLPLAGAEVVFNRPVTLIVPFPAAGGPDLAARILASRLQERLGQAVVIENKPGASSMIGLAAVERAAPDGQTLLFTTITTVIAPYVLSKEAGDRKGILGTLVPVIAPATTPMLLVASPRLGVTSLKPLIDLARSKPGLTYGSAGIGSGTHFAGEMFKRAAGVDLLHVPYPGVAPSIVGTMRGDTSLLFAALGAALPQIKNGNLVPLAITEKKRSSLLPEVPTATEQGVSNVEIHAWYGIFAPTGTPDAVRDKLNQAVNAVLALPEVKKDFAAQGVEVLGGTPAELAGLVKADDDRYGAIARSLNIRAE
ncbi:tripartite tricarboxylate transporter substrate binding protein [Pigmentiphaga sp. YJ18]|uniref:Bug family tripartite tricarboxylate transporter substrate binding protein n=1 Tax=Pigmentiphaga sp. YJ18 TaxID=3134907 RepID=UPI00311072A0